VKQGSERPGSEHRTGRPGGVVVVGTGFIADQHLAALRTTGRARLAGIVDIDPGRARNVSFGNGGVPWTTGLDEALGWPDCDAVIVCTPNDSHAPIALRVAAAGKHLLMEKPLAITVADAVAVHRAFQGGDGTLAVAHTHRAYDYSRAVRQVIESGQIGTPLVIRLAFLGGWIWGDWRAWVLDPTRSGGHVLHNGVHLLDTVTWWMGDYPRTVYARGRRQTAGQLGIDDHLELVLGFDGGRFAVCEMSRAHRPARFAQRDVLVVGTEGTIAQPHGGDGSEIVDDTGSSLLPALASDAFARQLDCWLDGVQGGSPLAGPDDGVLAVAMAVAAQRSIESGSPVPLADVLPAGTLPKQEPSEVVGGVR
jgi:predicted dehydrogenase